MIAVERGAGRNPSLPLGIIPIVRPANFDREKTP
jgi:hypothetical protein